MKVHSTLDTEFPLVQSIDEAHSLGCHHVVTDAKGTRAVSAGFAGDVKVWSCKEGHWSADQSTTGMSSPRSTRKQCRANQIPTAHLASVNAWAVALSEDGQYLAGVSQDGHIRVWDLSDAGKQLRDHETKGSFGTCIDLVSPSIQKPSIQVLLTTTVGRWQIHCQRA